MDFRQFIMFAVQQMNKCTPWLGKLSSSIDLHKVGEEKVFANAINRIKSVLELLKLETICLYVEGHEISNGCDGKMKNEKFATFQLCNVKSMNAMLSIAFAIYVSHRTRRYFTFLPNGATVKLI